MELLTLLRANIRHRKGSFTSIILLMLIISMSLTAVLSVRDNCRQGIENAFAQADAGDLTVFIKNQKLTEELFDAVNSHPMVEKAVIYNSICTEKTEAGGKMTNNSWFLLKLREGYRLFNSDLNGYSDHVPALSAGEIYVTQGVLTSLECAPGDTLTLYTIGGKYEFKIKGIVVEPLNGASVIGWKQAFISDADFERLYAEAAEKETEEKSADIAVFQIYKSADCELSNGQFKRQLNLDTGIVDKAEGSLTRDIVIHYTNLFPDIISSVLVVFITFLFVIVLIVMGHSISTGIEMDYVNLGVLKSQGFTKGKIRIVFVLQYLLAEAAGASVGMLLAVRLSRALGAVFQPITAILAEKNISFLKSLLLIFGILAISGIFVFLITKKVGKISPVRAIAGGSSEIYFDSRLKAPLCRKGLSASLALRQFISGKRRYLGTIIIVGILVFFMVTVTVLGNMVSSKSALAAMGNIITECDVSFREEPDEQLLAELEETIQKYSLIRKRYYLSTSYLSVNGEEIYCQIYKNSEMIENILKGRAALYENEIVITEIIADELGLKLGDKVIVSHNDQKAEYIITGIFQSTFDTGLTFAMLLSGAERLGSAAIYSGCYSLGEPEKSGEIAAALNAEFGEVLEAKALSIENYFDGTDKAAIDAMRAVIYSFSIIFALVVVSMVCAKTFLQEKTDIGIYKALGFTSWNLRLQFAVRFLIVALSGSVLGALFSLLFSGRLLSSILRIIGITSFPVEFTAFSFLAPVCLICSCFFLFALVVSGKIGKVEVRELVTE